MQDILINDSYQNVISENFIKILKLIESNNLLLAKKELKKLHYADLADFLDNAENKIYNQIIPLISDSLEPETLACINTHKIQPVINVLGIEKSAQLINHLDLEDSIEIIENLDDYTKKNIIQNLDKEQKKKILEGVNYPEQASGRFIEKNYIIFKDKWTVKRAKQFIKDSNIDLDDISNAIVVNNRYHPVGTLSLSSLLKANNELSTMNELFSPMLQYADCYTDIEHVIFLFKQYSLKIIPVVNKSGKIIGVISLVNMIHLVEEQAESKFMQIGGIHDLSIFANIFESVKQRLPWLFVNLISSYFTSIIIAQFTESLSKIIILASLMPIVASMGGNVGSQTMTIHIMALSNRELTNINMIKKIAKELIICTVNGILLAFVGGIIIYIVLLNLKISIIFFLAVVLNFLFAGILGTGIPIILDHFSIDPATASGVIITGLTDAFGYFCFLALAYILL
ncbi:MAG: magnesium transporter [Rickettsia sp.]|nr:magnesium transporter [Rickettsia sp.]